MSDNYNSGTYAEDPRSNGRTPTSPALGTVPAAELTMEYVLTRMDMIMGNTAHIQQALEAVKSLPLCADATASDGSRGEAIAAIARSRETTNQMTLRILESMYNDLKPLRESRPIDPSRQKVVREMIGEIIEVADELPPDTLERIIDSILQTFA